MSAIHVSLLGNTGRDLPRCLDGFTYTTPEEWLGARVDDLSGPMTRDQAEERARQVSEAIKAR